MATYMRVTYVRVRACGQECELPMLPGTPICASALDRNLDKQRWDSHLLVDNEAQQSIQFKHREWEFSSTTKVLAVDECLHLRMCVRETVWVCMGVFNIQN